MASPLSFFRRHQKGIMVAVICLCMFTFVVADAMNTNSNPEALIHNLPLMMGLLFGIIVGWIIGFKKENVWAYIAVCGLIGGILFNMGGSKIDLGAKPGETGVPEQKLNAVIRNQQFANSFFFQLRDMILGRATRDSRKFFSFQQKSEQNDAVIAEAYLREADKMGMVIPNQSISELIVNFTQKSINKQQFAQLLKNFNVTENQLYDVLKEQMAAQNAFRVLQPLDYPTPYSYWDAYRKLNQRAQLDVVSLNVANFIEDVKTPDDETLKKFFAEHKEVLPGAKAEGSAGFKLPPRAKIAYVEIDYDDIEKTIPEITPKEIEEYYNANKEKYPVNVFDMPVTSDEKTTPKTDESAKPTDSSNDSKIPAEKNPVDSKPAETTIPEMKLPTDNKPVEPAKPESKVEEKPVDKPVGEPQSGLSPESVIPHLANKKFWQASLLQEEKPATEKPADKPAEDNPQNPKKPVEKVPEQPAVEPKVTPDLPSATMTTGTSLPISTIPEGFEKPVTTPPATEAPKIRPLDDELKKEIKDTLLKNKTLEKLEATSKEIEGKLYDLGTYTSYLPSDPGYKSPEQANKEFKELADQKKLYFNITKLLSQKQFSDMKEEYAIVNSITPLSLDLSRAFPNNTSTFEEIVFTEEKPVLYSPMALEDIQTKNRYVSWITEYSAQHVPTFEEEGVKEFVLNTWKSHAARELIAKRGKEIIEMLKKSEKSLSETLGGQTETGKDNSSQLVVGTTGSFTWMTSSTVPVENYRTTQQVELSPVQNISGGAGDEFMEIVFNQISLGECGIVPNVDKTVYFIVKLVSKDSVDSMYPKLLEENGWLKQNQRSVGALFGEKQEKVREKFQEQVLKRNGLRILTKEDEEKIEQQKLDAELKNSPKS